MVLPDLGDVQVAGLAVEAELIGIAKPVGPDFRLRPRMDVGKHVLGDAEQAHQLLLLDEGIVGRNRVRTVFGVDVDAEDLTEPGAEILAGLQGIAFPAAVSAADVKVSVRSEPDLAAARALAASQSAQIYLPPEAGLA